MTTTQGLLVHNRTIAVRYMLSYQVHGVTNQLDHSCRRQCGITMHHLLAIPSLRLCPCQPSTQPSLQQVWHLRYCSTCVLMEEHTTLQGIVLALRTMKIPLLSRYNNILVTV